MANRRAKFYKKLNLFRRISQILSILLLIAIPILNVLGVHWLMGTLYSMSIGPVDIADPLISLQTMLLTGKFLPPLLVAVLIPIAIALLFGRVFCSWVCPHNTISEWLDALQKRLFPKRWQKQHTGTGQPNPRPRLYWTILAALLLLTVLLGFPLISYLSAPGVISSQISQVIMGMGVGLEIGLVLLIFVVELAIFRRVWCKWLCPIGAFLALFRTPYTLQIHYDASQCACGHTIEPCHNACPLDLSPKKPDTYPFCYNCGLCQSACERTGRGAITFKIGK